MTKKILITGKNSYIGTSFIEYCQKNNIDFDIEELSVHGDEWKDEDFSKYDVVLNVASIAHQKETVENEHLYYEINRDLAVEIAEKAKYEGVKYFIFTSTMSVYGLLAGTITENTLLKPKSFYGKSKLQAEEKLKQLSNDSFKIAILRPPMIYGPNCKGNYQTLSMFAQKTKIFPDINNERSMLFIDNLSRFFIGIIENSQEGIFFPQNKEYVSTKKMINEISNYYKNDIRFISIFNLLIKYLNINVLDKVFGSLIYQSSMSQMPFNYQKIGLKESIKMTERGQ